MTAIVIPNTFLPSTTISSTAMNANFTAVATAIDNSLDLAGTETMTGQLRGADGSAIAPGYSFGADLNTGIYRKATDQIGFATAGALAFFLDAAAKGWFSAGLDIATTLHVGTTLLVDGAATLSAGLTMSSASARTTFAESLAGVGAGFGTITGIAAAGTTDLGTITSHYANVTGGGTITSFGSSASTAAPFYLVRFAATTTITSSASLAMPGGVSMVLGDNDHLLMRYAGSGNWQGIGVFRNSTGTPTVQRFTSGAAATYTPATGVRWIKGRMVGGGGGGGARATNNGTAGGQSIFGTWTANGGAGGTNSSGSAGGAGGSGGTNGTGTLITRNSGGTGESGQASVSGSSTAGGSGANSPFGGAGVSATSGDGTAAQANSGSGGGGAGNAGSSPGGSGGGSGEYVEFIMTAAQIGASLSYTVGAAGAGGAAGTNAGGNGAAGLILIEEYY